MNATGAGVSPGRIDHVGIVVTDLDAARAHFGRVLGLRWSPVQEWTVEGRGPGGPVRASVRLCWSLEGPVHTELIQGEPGSIWSPDGDCDGELHHVAYCVDDVDAVSDRLASLGLPLEVAGTGTSGRTTGFAYHRSPQGLRVELMPEEQCAAIARWLAKLSARAVPERGEEGDES